MPGTDAYIIAARRAANGRIGGLHRNRRLEDLASPVITEALADAGVAAARVDLLVLGNTSAGNNPAHLAGLVAGIPEEAPAITIDRQEASGLEAILLALRAIAAGDAEIAVAGGVEALSTAPWRIAKPRTLYHTPRFLGLAHAGDAASGGAGAVDAANALASRLGLARSRLDELALTAHIKAGLARDQRRLAKEIVALKAKAEESRDELVDDLEIDDLESLPPIVDGGTATTGNTSALADGAAFVVVVSERAHAELGRPPALRLTASTSLGSASGEAILAPIAATRAVTARRGVGAAQALARIELGEASAAQAIAFRDAFGLADAAINADGGQLARGQPIGAASAVLAVRLFAGLVHAENASDGTRGLAVIGSSGGQAIAAVFERVGG